MSLPSDLKNDKAFEGQPFSRDGASLRGGCSGGAQRATAGRFDFYLFGLMDLNGFKIEITLLWLFRCFWKS